MHSNLDQNFFISEKGCLVYLIPKEEEWGEVCRMALIIKVLIANTCLAGTY